MRVLRAEWREEDMHTDDQLWKNQWEDDQVDETFAAQLRAEFKKA